MTIKRNLHSLDRLARTIIGVGCIYYGFIDHNLITNTLISVLVGLFGLVNIGAAIMSHCPVYGISGLSTYKEADTDNTSK